MTKLGGHALYLKPGEIHLGVRESIKDSARVISRMVDAIEARTLKHATVTELARYASVPVINGLTDYNHPTQVLCDVFTMREHRPVGKPLEALTVAFIGDATNVCSSLMMICTQMGMTFVHCAPPRYQAPEAWQSIARDNCAQSGGRLWVTDDPALAVAEADFVYTDLWWWVGQEAEIPERQAAFMPRYQINDALLAKAPPHAKFMHCLPASRGVEVTDAVMDGPRANHLRPSREPPARREGHPRGLCAPTSETSVRQALGPACACDRRLPERPSTDRGGHARRSAGGLSHGHISHRPVPPAFRARHGLA